MGRKRLIKVGVRFPFGIVNDGEPVPRFTINKFEIMAGEANLRRTENIRKRFHSRKTPIKQIMPFELLLMEY